jgi:hypothetical protein
MASLVVFALSECKGRALRHPPEADCDAVETLRAERDHWKANHDEQVAKRRRLGERYAALHAENKRLREALKSLGPQAYRNTNREAVLEGLLREARGYLSENPNMKEGECAERIDAALAPEPDTARCELCGGIGACPERRCGYRCPACQQAEREGSE